MSRYCFALVVLIAGSLLANVPGQENFKKTSNPSQKKDAIKPDPAATELMSNTHPSWAHWEDFPGFTADLEVNLDGKISKGRVEVSSKGKVKMDLPRSAAQSFAKEALVSIVNHRLGQRLDIDEPCVFLDENTTHPLGRAVHVINDEPGTSFRIRDREVIEVNRLIRDVRYTHIILENRANKDKKHLAVSFVAYMWDGKTGALLRTDANHQTWERVGKFDLPMEVIRIMAGADNKLVVGTLKLSNFKLTSGQ